MCTPGTDVVADDNGVADGGVVGTAHTMPSLKPGAPTPSVQDTLYDVPGTRVVVEDQRSEADGRVFTRFTVRVSPPKDAETSGQSTLPGGEWEYSGMSICRVVEGKIEESWLVWEALRAAEELASVFGVQEWLWPP